MNKKERFWEMYKSLCVAYAQTQIQKDRITYSKGKAELRLDPDVLYDLAANAAAIVGGFETAAQCMMKEIPGED